MVVIVEICLSVYYCSNFKSYLTVLIWPELWHIGTKSGNVIQNFNFWMSAYSRYRPKMPHPVKWHLIQLAQQSTASFGSWCVQVGWPIPIWYCLWEKDKVNIENFKRVYFTYSCCDGCMLPLVPSPMQPIAILGSGERNIMHCTKFPVGRPRTKPSVWQVR